MQQLSLFYTTPKEKPKIALEELFNAYYSCRHNKRNTANAIAFEIDYESNLIQLCNEINNGTYQIGRSIAFIVNKPVKREILAADFRDRIVHYLIINKLNHLFEKEFIYDSYGCRINKGTHFGIKRVDTFIRKCSKNYTQDCYVLKLDIQGSFMHINKNVLWQKLEVFINQKYHHADKELILKLSKQVVFNNPTQNCIVKGKRSNWNGLPNNKSLFYSPKDCGLPIGNLTNQVFANFYMNTLDH
jgi:RNA-directed DNA polymerase